MPDRNASQSTAPGSRGAGEANAAGRIPASFLPLVAAGGNVTVRAVVSRVVTLAVPWPRYGTWSRLVR